MRPVVLDTDIGVDPDDSFAILLLERTLQQQQRERERERERKRRDGGDGAPGSEHDPVRLVGVTTVGSFVGIKTALARFYLCNLLGIHTTPVFRVGTCCVPPDVLYKHFVLAGVGRSPVSCHPHAPSRDRVRIGR